LASRVWWGEKRHLVVRGVLGQYSFLFFLLICLS